MSTFLRKGFSEHRRVAELRRDLRRSSVTVGDFFDEASNRDELFLLLLAPLVEVAWADGRITARETEALLEIADIYGIADDETAYCFLLERLIERPSKTDRARTWLKIERFLNSLGSAELEAVCDAVLIQAHYVAEQSSNNLIGFLRGDGLNKDEVEILRKISADLRRIRGAFVASGHGKFEARKSGQPAYEKHRGRRNTLAGAEGLV